MTIRELYEWAKKKELLDVPVETRDSEHTKLWLSKATLVKGDRFTCDSVHLMFK